MSEKRHPGITMHRLSFGGGVVGLTFVVGSMLIFVLGLPALWYFVAFSVLLGIGIAALQHYTSSQSSESEHDKPLSILRAQDESQSRVTRDQVPREQEPRVIRSTGRFEPGVA